MKTVGVVFIEPYQMEDFINVLFANGYVVELSTIEREQGSTKIQAVIKEK